MKRVSVILLAALMLMSIALGGCALKGEKLLIGTWEGKVDILPLFQSEMDDVDDEFTEYLDLEKSYKVTMTMSFAKDGTYELSADEDEMKDAFEAVLDAYSDALVLALEDMIKDEGLTVEAFEDSVGMSLKKYVDQEFDALDLDDDLSDLEEGGEWELDGDKLTIDDDVTYTVELEKGSLTFTDCDDKDDDFLALTKDVTFKKQ